MCYQIKYAYTCHIGKIRGNNEDNFWCCGAALLADNQGSEGIHKGVVSAMKLPAMAVFDGMGGESCGEIAAYLASKEFGKYYEMNKKNIQKDPDKFMEELCREMNHAVCSFGTENKIRSMGTTFATMIFGPESVFACNLGDSRIYMSGEAGFCQISRDHVADNYAFGKAPLTQYLGIPEEQQIPEPTMVEFEYKAGERFLLCSDGVTDMLSDGEIAEILTKDAAVEEIVAILLDKALGKGGRDNTTLILCEVEKRDHRDVFRTWLKGFWNFVKKSTDGNKKENEGETI